MDSVCTVVINTHTDSRCGVIGISCSIFTYKSINSVLTCVISSRISRVALRGTFIYVCEYNQSIKYILQKYGFCIHTIIIIIITEEPSPTFTDTGRIAENKSCSADTGKSTICILTCVIKKWVSTATLRGTFVYIC